jgi:hypothetical protein
MRWTFKPYVGISDIHFDLARGEIETLLGTPKSIRRTYTGKTRIAYGPSMPAFVFENEALIEASMLPELSGGLFFEGVNLLAEQEENVVRLLTERDELPQDRNGFLILSKLGIALSGFDPPASDQKAITVFGPRHAWSAKATSIAG